MAKSAKIAPRREALKMVAPFAGLSLVGLAAAMLIPVSVDRTLGLVSAALTVALIGVAVATPWQRLPAWTRAVPPMLYLGIVALLREASDGTEPGVATLTMLPVIWFALHGSRRQVAMAVAGVGCVFFTPIALGVSTYPPHELIRGGIWIAVAMVVGLTMQGLVTAHRRQAAELSERAGELAASNNLVEGVLRAATEYSIIGTDGAGLIEVYNSGAERMLGYSADEMIGKHTLELIHDPDEVARRGHELGVDHGFEALVAKARGGEHETRRWTYLCKDASRIPVELTVTAMRGAAGEVRGFIGIANDISERVRSESALRASEGALLAVSRVSKEIANSGDARQSICDAALELCGADLTVLMEPDGEERLVMTAASGIELPRMTIAVGKEPSGSAAAFMSGERMFVAETETSPVVSRRVITALGAGAVLFEPVLRDGVPVGVLNIAWRQPNPELDDRVGIAAGLLASEAGVAIERSDLMARLEGAALTDPLTGLANRRAWDETVPRVLTRAAELGHQASVAMLDLDHFKAFNDRFGHQAGDRLLVEVSAAWREQLRDGDLLARYGGEEFALLIPNCSATDTRAVLERIRVAVPKAITCSAGLAVVEHNERADAAVARADAALYEAKERGRDTMLEYSETTVWAERSVAG